MNLNQRNRSGSNVIRIKDALIEEIFRDRNAGYVTISYGEMGQFNMIHMMVLQLIIGQDTIIQNQFGQRMRLRDLEKGMTVDVEFSNAITASEPPQARAFKIVVLSENEPSNVKVGRVMLVNCNNRFFITGKPKDINSQIRYNVTSSTIIVDRKGNKIGVCNLRPGQMVRVKHASFMTFSIPPQTTAYIVQII